MAKTLLDRLRSYLEWREDWPNAEIPLVIDRIELLEAALQKIAALPLWEEFAAIPIARAALEGKDD